MIRDPLTGGEIGWYGVVEKLARFDGATLGSVELCIRTPYTHGTSEAIAEMGADELGALLADGLAWRRGSGRP